MPVLITLILLSYPLVVHLSIYSGNAIWAAYFLASLFALPLPYNLVKGRRPGWIIGLTTLYSATIFWFAGNQAENLLFARPVIINFLIFALFASTLVGDSQPLVTRFATIIRKDVPAEVDSYCRKVTWVWAVFFLFIAIISIYLSVSASIEIWSWFTNVLTYILIMVMFILEFAVRRFMLKEHMDRSFLEFIRDLKKIDFSQVSRGWWT